MFCIKTSDYIYIVEHLQKCEIIKLFMFWENKNYSMFALYHKARNELYL